MKNHGSCCKPIIRLNTVEEEYNYQWPGAVLFQDQAKEDVVPKHFQ